MNKFDWNKSTLSRIDDQFARFLTDVSMEGVEAAKENVHVVTGRLQLSVRLIPPVKSGKAIESGLQAGGVHAPGQYQEVGLHRDVNYALEEELRHPQIQRSAIPAIKQAIKNHPSNKG